MQHTTTDGWNEGGVELGQLGVAAPAGWDQYSLFLSSSLPRSRVHEPHRTYTREPPAFFSLLLRLPVPWFAASAFRRAARRYGRRDGARYLGNEGKLGRADSPGREGAEESQIVEQQAIIRGRGFRRIPRPRSSSDAGRIIGVEIPPDTKLPNYGIGIIRFDWNGCAARRKKQ